MTREEFVRNNSWILAVIRDRCELTNAEKDYLNILIEVLEQKADYKAFCEFVAKAVMRNDFEQNASANAEIFCRKLAELGIVKANGDYWELESEVEG